MTITCRACQPPLEFPGTTLAEFSAHYDTTHGHLANLPSLPDLNDARSRAIAYIRAFPHGHEFQLHTVFAVTGDLPNHRHAAGGFTVEIEHLDLAYVVRYEKSGRGTTKGSALAVWRRGPKPDRQESSAA